MYIHDADSSTYMYRVHAKIYHSKINLIVKYVFNTKLFTDLHITLIYLHRSFMNYLIMLYFFRSKKILVIAQHSINIQHSAAIICICSQRTKTRQL